MPALRIPLLALLALLALGSLLADLPAANAAGSVPPGRPVIPAGGALDGHRYRVVVSTDLGGTDPDDFQSMVHLLV